MLSGIAILAAADLLIAALAARPLGARLAPALAAALLLLPVLAEQPLARLVLAVLALLTFFRVLDLADGTVRQTFGGRLVHLLLLIFDSRGVTRRPPSLATAAPLRLAAAILVGLPALGVAYAAEEAAPWARYACRWLGGTVLLAAITEGSAALLELIMTAAGLSAPRLHDAPFLSRSVAEFWGRRWNLGVARILRRRFFAPLARRGPGLALVATFAVSAAGHAYGAGAALGPGAALAWGAFFLVQPLLIAAERRLGVARWPTAAGHAWTIAAMLAVSPLFVEPAMRMFDPLVR